MYIVTIKHYGKPETTRSVAALRFSCQNQPAAGRPFQFWLRKTTTIEQTILLQLMTSLRNICQTVFVGRTGTTIKSVFLSHQIINKRTLDLVHRNATCLTGNVTSFYIFAVFCVGLCVTWILFLLINARKLSLTFVINMYVFSSIIFLLFYFEGAYYSGTGLFYSCSAHKTDVKRNSRK